MGGITDAVGLTDNKGAKKAAKASAKQMAQATEMSEESIAFLKKQYADWKKIFGPIQDNLSDFYQNLSSDRVASLGLENQQKEFQSMQKQLALNFAQRGISPDSALNASTSSTLGFANATERARIRTQAPITAAQEKLNFLSIGMGQGNNLQQGIANAYQAGAATAAGISNTQSGLYNDISGRNTDTMGSIFGMGLNGLLG